MLDASLFFAMINVLQKGVGKRGYATHFLFRSLSLFFFFFFQFFTYVFGYLYTCG